MTPQLLCAESNVASLVVRGSPEWAQSTVWNHAMHWGALGGLRGVWAVTGLRGPRASLVHTAVRLATGEAPL